MKETLFRENIAGLFYKRASQGGPTPEGVVSAVLYASKAAQL
jgi:hypothetical protein